MRRIAETRVTMAIVTMVTVSVGREMNILMTLMHGRSKVKLI